jgi:parallel beta-helix repeat protein
MTGMLFLNNCANISIYDSYGSNFATNTFTLLGGAGIVSAVDSEFIFADNCYVNGSGYGVNLEGTVHSVISNCKIKNSFRDGILVYHGANNNRIIGNYIEGYSSGLQSGRGGIQAYGVWNPVVTGNTVVNGYASNPQDTGGIRFRDAANFTCVGNNVTNAPSGILCNQASDFPGIMTYGVISGNSVDRCVFSDIHVAGNCGYVAVTDNITPNANTAGAANVASITINSPYALVSGNIISNNVGNAWGIYGGSGGLLIANNKLINVGNGGGSTPQIAVFGTNIALYGNHFTDDRATSIGYLGIKIYTNCSASIGHQFYGTGITNYIEVNSNATFLASSAPYPNRFATTPTVGTYQAGALSRGSGGRMFRSNGSGWSEDVFMDSIYPNNSTINFYSSTAVATGVLIGLSSCK